MQNIFCNPTPDSREEVISEILNMKGVRIEQIISTGQTSPDGFWYDQDENEWVIVLSGEAEIEYENSNIFMKKGDYELIPAHKRHRVSYTSKSENTVWLAVFIK